VALSVRAVERALDILLCFSAEGSALSLSQIAESVHLSKPTVHRLLATLEKKRFIAKDQATSQYQLGIYGQLGIAGSVPFMQNPEKSLKTEPGEARGLKVNTPSGSNRAPVFVAAVLPKNPQASPSFGSQ
jgi:hypothetical protein